MRDQLQAGMEEATRLTREGRLTEATSLIQRTLGSRLAPEASPDAPGVAEPARRAANEAVQTSTISPPGPTEHGLRRAPGPPRRFRGMPRPSAPGTTPGAATGSAVVSAGGQFIQR